MTNISIISLGRVAVLIYFIGYYDYEVYKKEK
jgi:hypothetical protein